MGIIVTSIKVFDKNCIGCARHKRHVMIAYTFDNSEDITDIFLTQDQAEDLANDLVVITKRNEAKAMKENYIIEGNHPTLKYVNLKIDRLNELSSKIGNLLANGYEVTIRSQSEQIDKPESLGDVLRSAMDKTERDLLQSPTGGVLGPVLKTLEE